MRLLVDGRDLVNVDLKKLAGLDVTVVSYEELDSTLVNKVKEVANEVVVEELRNKMQMITFVRLQLLDSNKVFFSSAKNMLAMLCRKNCANDLDLTVAYIMGKLRLGKLKVEEKEVTTKEEIVENVVVDLEEKIQERVEENSLKARLDRVRAFREAK